MTFSLGKRVFGFVSEEENAISPLRPTFSLGKRVFAFAIYVFDRSLSLLRRFSFSPVIVFSLHGHVFAR